MLSRSALDSLTAFWIAFGIAAIAAYPIFRILLATKSRQTVSEFAPEGHQVKQGTPTMGGLIPVLAVSLGLIPYCSNHKPVVASIVLMLGFALIGFVDDFVVPRVMKGKRGLGWKQKIVMQLVLAIVGVGLVFGWQIDSTTMGSVFLVLFFSNAYNFSDGLDGLAGSLLLCLVAGFAGIAFAAPGGSDSLLPILGALAGGIIPFLYLNAPPAKVFMGDVGALPIGAVLGLVASGLIFSTTNDRASLDADPLWPAVLVASIMMIIELVPVPIQIFSVKVFKRKVFPFTPIHHAFEKAGWKETRVVCVFALTQLLCSGLAVSLVALRKPDITPTGRNHYHYYRQDR